MSVERQVRKETDFWGNEKEVIYENDRKIGEIKTEERGGFLGIGGESVKVEYDNSGREVSHSKQEERGGFLGIGAKQVEVRYDSSGNEISHSRVEERGGFFGIGGHHVRVEYDNNQKEISQTNTERRGGFLGIGDERVRVTRYSKADAYEAPGEPLSSGFSGGGNHTYIGSSSGQPTTAKGLSIVRLILGAICGFGIAIVGMVPIAIMLLPLGLILEIVCGVGKVNMDNLLETILQIWFGGCIVVCAAIGAKR